MSATVPRTLRADGCESSAGVLALEIVSGSGPLSHSNRSPPRAPSQKLLIGEMGPGAPLRGSLCERRADARDGFSELLLD
jgi:hypothetical protein